MQGGDGRDGDGQDGDGQDGEGRADKVKRVAAEKERRLAEALRANLHRRKAQSRARADDTAPAPEPAQRPEEKG